MTALSVRDLAVTYRSRGGEVPAVRGVTFDIDDGETLGVAGESGCGKTTMAMALLRLLPATAQVTGNIMFRDEDVLAMKPGRLRSVRWAGMSMVFQGAQHVLNPVHRIGRQIAEAMDAHHLPSGGRRIGDLLESVGLTARRADDYPHELSGGQRQRVMIAMALACEPKLIIADEPTTALDVMVQAQVLDLLRTIGRERGLAMIFVTHDLSVLRAVADRTIVLYAGRIVEQGPTRAVLSEPVHPYAAALAGASPTIGDPTSRFAPSSLSGDPPDPAHLPTGCPFHPRCPRRISGCDTVDVGLRNVGGDARSAACLHVPEAGGRS